MKADAEVDARVRRHSRITLGHSSLHLGRIAQCAHHTAELDEKAVARRLD